MRGKSAAAAPFSGATVQLAGSSGYFICFLQLFAAEKQQKPLRPVTRAAACGPVGGVGRLCGFPANLPRRFPHPGRQLLLRPRDTVGDISPALNKRPNPAIHIRSFSSAKGSMKRTATFHLPFSSAFRRRKAAKAAPACHAGGCLRPGCGVGRPYGFASKPSPTLSAPRPQASSSPS